MWRSTEDWRRQLFDNETIDVAVMSFLFFNEGGREFIQSFKFVHTIWKHYLRRETLCLHLCGRIAHEGLGRGFLKFPDFVRNVTLQYPNLWRRDPPIFYGSLSQLRQHSVLSILTLRFNMITEWTLDNLMIHLLDLIFCMQDDVMRQFTLRRHFENGICARRTTTGDSLAWQQSDIMFLLYRIWHWFGINFSCLYNEFSIIENDVLDVCGSKPIPLSKAEFLGHVIRSFPCRRRLFESRCKGFAPELKIIGEKGDPVTVKLRELQRVCRHETKVKSVIVSDERREYQHFCAECGWISVFVQDRLF